MTEQARRQWRARFGRPSDAEAEQRGRELLLPPTGLRAQGGRGQVTLRWEPVPGAMGYLVSRAESAGGPFTTVDTGGPDVQAVPGPPFCDTTAPLGRSVWYGVAALADQESGPGSRCMPVVAVASPEVAPAEVAITVDAGRDGGRLRRLWRMIGSERLSQLLSEERTAGRAVAGEFAEALRRAHTELGVTHVRAHAILHDDLGVYRSVSGRVALNFDRVDAVYDRLLDLGLKPVVELSFMPADLAREPDATVFAYEAIISPPKRWDRWEQLVRALAEHLVDRYGLSEVRQWPFEVWNEPNLEVFWAGTQAEYLQLYAVSARAVKAVDAALPVVGPATSAASWIGTFLDHAADQHLPLDAVTSHTYGNLPLDVRPALAARDLRAAEVWWTEWGVMTKHDPRIADAAYGAPFVLHGLKRSQEHLDRLAYWVVSDHFEEFGRPERLLHGGFGLLTVGNLPKPRWWALRFAEELGDDLLAVELDGDGAGGLVDAWAARARDGGIDVLIWNATLDQAAFGGVGLLDRRIRLRVGGLPGRYRATLERVDREHASVADAWGGGDWPRADEWQALRDASTPNEEPLGAVEREAEFAFELPMPGVARLRLRPVAGRT